MSLQLEILVPEGVALQCQVVAFQGTDASGRFGLLPGHERFITLLAPCLLVYREEGGHEHYAAVDGGVLLLEDNNIRVVTREAIEADRLEEVADAAADMLARRRLHEATSRAEFTELQMTLLHQLREVQKTL